MARVACWCLPGSLATQLPSHAAASPLGRPGAVDGVRRARVPGSSSSPAGWQPPARSAPQKQLASPGGDTRAATALSTLLALCSEADRLFCLAASLPVCLAVCPSGCLLRRSGWPRQTQMSSRMRLPRCGAGSPSAWRCPRRPGVILYDYYTA